jgi:hypothetical protein
MKKLLLLTAILLHLNSFGNVYVVTNTNATGGGSLTYAISAADSHGGLDTVVFNIAGSAPFKIKPVNTINVTDALFIDGTSQPGYNFTTREPVIEIDGSLTTTGSDGFYIYSGTHLHGLIINRFARHGVFVGGDNNVLSNLWIGTDSTGTQPASNGFSGVYVNYGKNNVIGGNLPSQRNIISGSSASNNAGIYIQGNSTFSNNTVAGNYIGTDKTGSVAIPNFNGITCYFSKGDKIGNGGAGNLVSGNINDGIYIYSSDSTVVQNNYAGMQINGVDSLHNVSGISVYQSSYCLIGGAGANEGNLCSGNTQAGINISNGADTNYVQGNVVGLTKNGNSIKKNGYSGIDIYYSKHNLIGGNNPAQRNIVSGNGQYDVYLHYADSNIVSGNYLGTDTAGNMGFNIYNFGVFIEYAQFNIIGGATPGERNIISGHYNREAIGIRSQGNYNTVIGNYCGTNAAGTAAIPNFSGVELSIDAANNIIGGTLPGEGNLLSGNSGRGFASSSTGQGNKLTGNFIGTDYTGTQALPNDYGAIVYAPNLKIGEESGEGGNIISGNTADGLVISADSVLVYANFIGVDTALNPVGNGGNGVEVVKGRHIEIGKGIASSGNIIANNGGRGVFIGGSDTLIKVVVLNNRIYNNIGLGIDINQGGTGVSPNDSLDLDAGFNGLQNFPLVGCINFDGTNTVIDVNLNSRPNRSYYLELVKNDVPNASGYGEGKYIAGHGFAHTGPDGNTSLQFNVPGDLRAYYFAATATDSLDLVTSEYSPAVRPLGTTNVVANLACFGVPTGQINTTVIGGFPPYIYNWSNGDTGSVVTGLDTGSYIVNVTSFNGCVHSDTLYVSQPASAITIDAGADTSMCIYDTGKTFNIQGVWSSISWSPTVGLSNPVSPYTFANPTVTTSYVLTGVNISGCVAVDTVVIFVNQLPAPGFTAASVCLGDPTVFVNSSIVPSGVVASSNWNFGDGNTSSSMNPSNQYSTAGTFNVLLVVTSTNGCIDSMVQSIQVYSLPVVEAGADTSICIGSSAQFNATSGGVSYMWIPATDLSSTNIPNPVASPSVTTKYMLHVSDINGCYGADSLTVNVNPLPTVSISANSDSICYGDTITFAASGANTYSWSDGQVAQTIFVSPAISTIYSVYGTDINGCVNWLPYGITVNSTDLAGTITLSAGNVAAGKVELYQLLADSIPKVSAIALVNNGAYSFAGLKTGQYLVRVVADSIQYPFAIPTYRGGIHRWDLSTPWTASCLNQDTINVDVIDLTPPQQFGAKLDGFIWDDSKKFGARPIRKPGEPIKGVGVIIQRRPGGSATQRSITDSTGYFSFDSIQVGNLYDLYVEMPNGTMINTYTYNITDSTQIFTNQDFYVDSTSGTIDTANVNNADSVFATKAKVSGSQNIAISVYPIPVSSLCKISISMPESDNITLWLEDITGRRISFPKIISINKDSDSMLVNDFIDKAPGVYFIQLRSAKINSVIKILKE